MSVKKMKEFESGEEFVFDGVKTIPVVGALYAAPRAVVYAAMGNKTQTVASAKGMYNNVVGTGMHILKSPITAANAIAKVPNKLFGETPPKE